MSSPTTGESAAETLDEVLQAAGQYFEDNNDAQESVSLQIPVDEQILSTEADIRNHQVELLRGLHMQYQLSTNNTVPSNTEKTTKWAVNAYTNWRSAKMLARSADCESIPENPAYASVSDLNYWLAVFVKECRQRDGREYKHQNLYGLVCGISRHIRKVRPNLNILDDPGMLDFKDSLYKVMRGLQAKQTEKTGGQIDILTKDQWEYLWNMGYLGTSNSTALFYAVISLFISAFGVTSATQLRNTTVLNIVMSEDADSGDVLVTYHPPEQNDYSNRDNTRKITMTYREKPSNPRSFSKLLKLYFSKLSEDLHNLGMWFRPCEGDEWYQRHPVGINLLRTTIKSLCSLACFKGNFSNHSLSSALLDKNNCSVTHILNKQPITTQLDNHMIIQHPPKTDLNSNVTNQRILKREFQDDDISTVIVNSHLPKRTRTMEFELPFPTSENQFYSSQQLFPANKDSETVKVNQIANKTEGPEIRINSETVETDNRTNNCANKHPDKQTGRSFENVRVDIPEHIEQCLGLFKDCTIQNVTINIYLGNKDKDT